MVTNKIESYKMSRTQNMPNIKECIGEIVRVDAVAVNQYADPDGVLHNVMALKLADGRYYRTEVAAFIEEMNDFWSYFGDDDEKPEIMIIGKNSKRGNEYVKFEVVG